MNKALALEETIEMKAETDGQFAIAYALLAMTYELKEVSSALRKLGLNDASTSMGAIELLSTEVKHLAETVGLGIQVQVASD